MGHLVVQVCSAAPDVRVVSKTNRDSTTEQLAQALAGADVYIDFSSPEHTQYVAQLALQSQTAAVIGTTALTPQVNEAIGDLAQVAPVMVAANFSRGVAILKKLIKSAQRDLPDASITMEESHHQFKKDMPSGTAIELARSLGQDWHVASNEPQSGIPISCHREGDIIGTHSVSFHSAAEVITLTHDATDRSVFARGALDAARWLVDQTPGFYKYADILN